MFSSVNFRFPENQPGGMGFVEIVSNIPAAQDFTFNVNGGKEDIQKDGVFIVKSEIVIFYTRNFPSYKFDYVLT